MADRTVTVALRLTLAEYQQGLQRAAGATRDFASKAATSARDNEKAWTQVGVAVAAVGAGFALATKQVVQAAVGWESAFAGVRKTVDGSDAQLNQMAGDLRNMARNDVPMAVGGLADIAAAAGQLGIQRENILGFTRTMADLGVATNLSGEQAATTLARLANITGMAQGDFDRLGSTIVDLGNNLATTEAEIAEMALRLAGAGAQIGLTEAQILGFAGALSSVGVEAEAGGSAFSRVMVDIAQAAATGGSDLEAFAGVAGMSAADFAAAFEADAAGAVVAFVSGLDAISKSGGNVFGVLEELGFGEIRVRDALLRSAGAGDLLAESIDRGSAAWEANTALTDEAAQRYDTTEAKIQFARNAVGEMAIELGENLLPAVGFAADAVGGLADGIGDLPEGLQTAVAGFGAATGAVGLLGGGFLLLLPRIAATKAAITTLGITAKSTMAFMGGPWGIALAAGALVLGEWASKAAEARGRSDEFSAALDDIEASAAATNRTLADMSAVRVLDEILARVEQVRDAENQIGDFGSFAPEIPELGDVRAVDDWADALGGVAERSAQAALNTIDLAVAQGHLEMRGGDLTNTLGQVVLTAADLVRVTADAGAEARRASLGFGDLTAAELAESNASMLTAQTLAGTTDVLTATGDAARWAGVEYDRHTQALITANSAHDVWRGTLAASNSEIGLAETTLESLNDTFRGFIDPMGAWSAAMDETRAQAQEWAESQFLDGEPITEWAQAHVDAGLTAADAVEGFVDEAMASLDDWLARQEQQIADQTAWAGNMVALSGRVSDDTIAYLAEMGTEGASLVAELVDATDDELGRVEGVVAANMLSADDELNAAMVIMQESARTGGRRSAQALADELGIGVEQVKAIAARYGIELAAGVNPLLHALGVPTILAGQQGHGLGLEAGGQVPGGYGSRDDVPAMLTRGEIVESVSAVRKWGPEPLLDLNAGRVPAGWVIPGYNAGGRVTGDLEGMHPELMRRLSLFSAAVGQTYHVTSGFRSRAEQQVLYDRYLAGTGNLAALPGSSDHERGLASDGPHWGGRNPAAVGLVYNVRGEPWHVVPTDRATLGSWSGVVDLPAVPSVAPYAGAVGKPATAQMTHARATAQAWLDEQFTFAGMDTAGGEAVVPPGGAVERWRPHVARSLGIVGQPAGHVDRTLRRMRQESGGDPNIVNRWDVNWQRGTPSVGLLQVIGPTYAAHKHPAHDRSPFEYGVSKDPMSNILASMRYALARYRSLPAAYDRAGGYNAGGRVGHGVYDDGGILPPGLTLAENRTGHSERILPPGTLQVEVTNLDVITGALVMGLGDMALELVGWDDDLVALVERLSASTTSASRTAGFDVLGPGFDSGVVGAVAQNAGTTAASIQATIDLIHDMQAAWEDAARAEDEAVHREALWEARRQAEAALAEAMADSAASMEDRVAAEGAVADAIRDIIELDREAAAAIEDRAIAEQLAVLAAQQTIAANREAYEAARAWESMDPAERVGELNRQMAELVPWTDEWVDLLEQADRIEADITAEIEAQQAASAAHAAEQNHLSALRAAEFAAERERNRHTLAFDAMSPEAQLAEINRRLAQAVEFSDTWMDLRGQAAQIEGRIADEAERVADAQRRAGEEARRAADEAGANLDRLLDQYDALRGRAADLTEQHETAVRDLEARTSSQAADAAARARTEIDGLIAAREAALGGFASMTERFVPSWGVSAGSLTRNLHDQVRVFDEWADAMSGLRDRGLDEGVIAALGLDDPAQVGQAQMLLRATDAELAALNDAYLQRSERTRERAADEHDLLLGALGESIVAINERLTGELDAIWETHRDTLADMTGQLTADLAAVEDEIGRIGEDTGRNYYERLVEALATGLPIVQAAADAYSDALDGIRTMPVPAGLPGMTGGGPGDRNIHDLMPAPAASSPAFPTEVTLVVEGTRMRAFVEVAADRWAKDRETSRALSGARP